MPESNTPTNKPHSFRGQIDINDEHAPAANRRRFEEACRYVLSEAGFQHGSLSIAIVSDETIAVLNKKYLGHEGPTDVLSFCLDSDTRGGMIDAEIIISAQTAQRVAREYGWTPEDETLLYVIHGALHLVGYDDHDDSHRKEMRLKEAEYLARFGLVQPQDAAAEGHR